MSEPQNLTSWQHELDLSVRKVQRSESRPGIHCVGHSIKGEGHNVRKSKTSTTPHKEALGQRREQDKPDESFKTMIVKGLGQRRGHGKGQQFISIIEIVEKSMIRNKLKKQIMRDFQHPLYFRTFVKQKRVGTSTAAGVHYALIEPVGIKQPEVELRSRRAVLDTAKNISPPNSS